MKKFKLKPLYIILVAVLIGGGTVCGLLFQQGAFTPEWSVEELNALLVDEKTARENIAEIRINPENGYYWTVKLKNPERERVIRKFPNNIGYGPQTKANIYRIPIHIEEGKQGIENLLRSWLHLN